MKKLAAILVAMVTPWMAAQAQQATADSAWLVGDFHTARINYERVLQADPHSVRANYRLGILASWDGRLDSALVLIRRARADDPTDPDLQAAEARVLSWDGQYDESIVLYDSVLARNPRHAEALTGLAQVHYWNGRYSVAGVYASRAVAADPGNKTARELNQSILNAIRPQPELTLGWSNDSDENTNWWQTLAGSYLLSDNLRAFGSLGALESGDAVRDAARLSAEAGLAYGAGNLYASAALGARKLLPDAGPDYSRATYRVAGGYRLGRAGVGIGFAHYPFDETALLIERRLEINALELSGDATLRPGLVVGVGGGGTWFSDDNTRTHGVLTLTQTLRRDFFVGLMARALGYDFKGIGYFSPDWFSVYEVRGGYTRSAAPWSGRVSGGLGVQQVGKGGKSQSEWHLEGRLGRSWGRANMVEVFAGLSNSAESSTTGAFRYRTAGVIVRIGL